MELVSFPLSTMIFLPGLAGLVLLLLPSRWIALHRWVSFLVSLATLALALTVLSRFDPNVGDFQLTESAPWLPSLGISYRVEVDGLSLLLVLLTALLQPVVFLSSWGSIQDKVKGYLVSMLVLETGVLGAFLATDLFLFYVFWELMLIPMYFIIGVWGGERRVYAAVKFVLFTLAGSLLMLVAILYMAFQYKAQTGTYSFAYADWLAVQLPMAEGFWGSPQMLAFAAFALAFAIKVPVWPLHTWLPDAHTEAPTGGSIILAGILLKLGTYGLLRFNRALFPEAWERSRSFFMILAVVAIIYGALVSWAQKDMKRLVAFSSVSHMGFIILGMFAGGVVATQGALLQMVNHGLSTGALFLLVGVLYDRRHTRMIEDYGGLAAVMPLYTGTFLLATLASVGLPGLNGFVGEFLILLGTYQSQPVAAAIGATGVILGAVYMLSLVQRVFWNPLSHEENLNLPDISWRELTSFAPLAVLMVWIGVYPTTFLSLSEKAVQKLLGG
ncbi:MAG: NADH-quinone oxidoreductase subunit M [Thermoanaerobaculum sp.]|nr:NADH-quinone oxidoreductase subunit M [Thermoanaerobaculum sp.]MDW7966624.1 NADH-quinone oxidoreductase subunit M [Thermoanaerobaculum sp.]